MALTVITPPSASPAVTQAEAKRWCGIAAADTAFDDLIDDLLASATLEVEELTGRAIGAQTLRLTLDGFSDTIELPKGPVSSVTSVTYYDAAGALQTASASLYTTDLVSDPQWIVLNDGEVWPDTLDAVNVVLVLYVTGYGANVPAPIKQAIRMLVAARFENRLAAMPEAVMALVEPYRAGWFAA